MFSRRGPQTSRIDITWELPRNACSQAYWIKNSGRRAWNLDFSRSSRWFWCMLEFEKHWNEQWLWDLRVDSISLAYSSVTWGELLTRSASLCQCALLQCQCLRCIWPPSVLAPFQWKLPGCGRKSAGLDSSVGYWGDFRQVTFNGIC